MVCAEEVTAADGRVLASAGSPVDEGMLHRLELAGVTELAVQGKTVPGADSGYNARERVNRLEHLFRAHRNDSFMTALQELLYKHFQARA